MKNTISNEEPGDKKIKRRISRQFSIEQKKNSDSDEESDESDDEDDYTIQEIDNKMADEELEILRQISQVQVATLLEMDGIISLAVASGTSKTVVYDTLSKSLSKLGYSFLRRRMPSYVVRLVDLIKEWSPMSGLEKPSEYGHHYLRSVLIYQHTRLLYDLLLGNFAVREAVIAECEEELVFYLFKPEFLAKLKKSYETITPTPNTTSSVSKPGYKRINNSNQAEKMCQKLNHIVVTLLQELKLLLTPLMQILVVPNKNPNINNDNKSQNSKA